MARQPNTNTSGNSFDQKTIDLVWEKANRNTSGLADIFRQDKCGTTISKARYGDINSDNGWEIDHILPVSKGGTDHIDNLQPLHWKTNRSKSDTYPWTCSML